MNIHLKILGWLYLVMGIVSLFATCWFAYAIFTGAPGSFSPDVQRILVDTGYGTALLALLAFASIGTLLTGIAFLREHRAARTLAYVFAVLGLFDFPLGTMLGVYTLWVLGQSDQSIFLRPERKSATS